MKKQQKETIKRFAILASVLMVLSLLALSGFIAYKKSLNETIQALQQRNHEIRTTLTQFGLSSQKLLAEISSTNGCQANSRSQLQSIAINDTQISIAFLKSMSQLCSNIETFQLPSTFAIQSKLNIQGPFSINGMTEPGYIISQLINKQLAGLVFPQSMLLNMTKTPLSPYLFSALYKKDISQILFINNKLDSLNSKQLTSHEALKLILNSHAHIKVISNIALYPHLHLLSAVSNRWVIKQIQHHLVLLLALAISLSSLGVFMIIRLAKNRLSLEYRLTLAHKNNAFLPHYQPVIDLETDRVCGVECLIRWKIDDELLLYPDAFIDALIDSPLIQPITENLIKKVFEDLGHYCAQHPDFHLAINLTPVHFKNEHIHHLALALCRDYHMKPRQVIFELTEQHLIDESDDIASKVMLKMQQSGFELALDDFGTGFANINYLQRFHFNYLKIDKQFVAAIHSGAVTENIASSIVHLAHNLNLSVIPVINENACIL